MDMPTKRADFDAADGALDGMVTRLLDGAPVESLDRFDEDGLVTNAFYPVPSPDEVPPPLLPMNAARRPVEGWRVVQTVPADMGNAEILDALMSGATGLMLSNADEDALASQLQGVMLKAVSIGLEAGAATGSHYHRLLSMAGADASGIWIDLGLDPVRDLAPGWRFTATHRTRTGCSVSTDGTGTIAA